ARSSICRAAIVVPGRERLRPKFMTVATMLVGLIPIMWTTGTGSDLSKRIAAPMVGGIFTSFVLEFVVYPAIYELWKWHFEMSAPAPNRRPPRSPPRRRPRRRREWRRTLRVSVQTAVGVLCTTGSLSSVFPLRSARLGQWLTWAAGRMRR